jgi:signal transduction histidine kinase
LQSGQPLLNREEAVVSASGEARWISTNKIALCDTRGEVVGIVGMGRDITEQLRAKKCLERANAVLAHKNEEMERLIYTVSHDLKSPLVTVQGYLGHLREDLTQTRTERLGEFTDQAIRAARRMSSQLDDLLKLSRAGFVSHAFDEVDLKAVVERVVSEMKTQFVDHGVKVETPATMPRINGDKARLAEVFQNLLSNALKYGCDGPDPKLVIGAAVHGEEVRCFVADNGPGIPDKQREKIFGLFQRFDTRHEGTGVGLTIVKRIVELHGGRVWVESGQGGAGGSRGTGATFWVAFPRPTRGVAAAA